MTAGAAIHPSANPCRTIGCRLSAWLAWRRLPAMEAMDQLELAGVAAERLEAMGFVSCARKKGGVVSVDLWKVVGGRQRFFRHVLTDADVDPAALAEVCAAELRAAVSED